MPERVPPIGLTGSGLNGDQAHLFVFFELLGLLLGLRFFLDGCH